MFYDLISIYQVSRLYFLSYGLQNCNCNRLLEDNASKKNRIVWNIIAKMKSNQTSIEWTMKLVHNFSLFGLKREELDEGIISNISLVQNNSTSHAREWSFVTHLVIAYSEMWYYVHALSIVNILFRYTYVAMHTTTSRLFIWARYTLVYKYLYLWIFEMWGAEKVQTCYYYAAEYKK